MTTKISDYENEIYDRLKNASLKNKGMQEYF